MKKSKDTLIFFYQRKNPLKARFYVAQECWRKMRMLVEAFFNILWKLAEIRPVSRIVSFLKPTSKEKLIKISDLHSMTSLMKFNEFGMHSRKLWTLIVQCAQHSCAQKVFLRANATKIKWHIRKNINEIQFDQQWHHYFPTLWSRLISDIKGSKNKDQLEIFRLTFFWKISNNFIFYYLK